MPTPASTPSSPVNHHALAGRMRRKAVTGSLCARRPMAISAIMIGAQISATQAR
jgi:hypothetical protein